MPTPKTTFDKLCWNFFSYIFHPLFIPVYCTLFLLYYNGNLFANNTIVAQNSLLQNVVINLVLFQLFTVFLLKQLKFINHIKMETQRERIAPIFVYTIFTFWLWAFALLKNPANQTSYTVDAIETENLLKTAIGYPKIAIRMGLAFFITSSLTLVCNSFFKISLHLIGVGLLLGLTIICFVKLGTNYNFILFAILISISTLLARKNTSNHTNFELYSGFMVGLLTMLGCQLLF